MSAKNNFHFVAHSEVNFEQRGNRFIPTDVSCSLDLSRNLEHSAYYDAEGNPTSKGTMATSQVLIQGLVATIKAAHELGHRDESEHLRWAIEQLQLAFVQPSSLEFHPI